MKKKHIKLVLINILVLLALLAPLEFLFFVLLRNPSWLDRMPGPIRSAVTRLYLNQDKRKLQFMPDCGQWDPQLGYRLKPGSCLFLNREFDTEYRINRMGLRDDEASLDNPEIIVLGDSFAMGWGVEQEEAFPFLLEKKARKKVLNTAVASYATARETLMLARINPVDYPVLIIQYCGENDYWENRKYVLQGNYLDTMDRQRYDFVVEGIPRINRWWPGKYIWSWIKTEIYMRKSRRPVPDPDMAVDFFLKTLASKERYLRNARIIVLEVNEHNHYTGFIPALKKRLDSGGDTWDFIERMETLDCSGFLGREDFFILDGHLNQSGHAKLARALFKVVSQPSQKGDAQ